MDKKSALLAVALAVAGLCILLWPVVSGHRLQADMSAAAQGFLEESRQSYPELLADLQGYNQRIYTERQAGLADALAYEEPAVLLRDYGVEDEIIGVLEIPTLELVMPVYLGASDSHLAAGAAVLGNTSAPIGGINTNCVIAGHRGWYGADYFRHIDRLQVDDMVTITNLWETLTYAVVDMKIIQPDQVDKIKIQPGRDLLTLITCHPYASGGRQRLVVYCERRKLWIIDPIGKATFVGDDDILYYDAESFLDCIRAELPYRDTTGFRYEVLTDDPAVCKAADDILLDFFSEDDPYTLSEYTQKIGGI